MSNFLDVFERWFFGAVFAFFGLFFVLFIAALCFITWSAVQGEDYVSNSSFNRARIERCKADGGTYTVDGMGWFTGCIVGPASVVINRKG